MLDRKVQEPVIQAASVVFICFLLTSTGWLIWNYHLLEYMPAESANIFTMVLGYFLQAAGIGIVAMILRYRQYLVNLVFYISLFLHQVFMIPAVVCKNAAAGAASGLLMELFCGIIAGYYLFYIVRKAPKEYRARVFGTGYGLSVLASWLLTLIGGGSLYFSEKILYICAAMTAAILFIIRKFPLSAEEGDTEKTMPDEPEKAEQSMRVGHAEKKKAEYNLSAGQEEADTGYLKEWRLIGFLVLLMGLAVNCGFSFCPVVEGETVFVEFPRIIYCVSLIVAGVITDKNRRGGAICALTTLVFPFIVLSLKGTVNLSYVFWMLSYAAFGFYSVYRIVLFTDTNILYLSGFGLMIGRISDAAGEAISLAMNNRPILHVGITVFLCVAVIFVFFMVYQLLYIPVPEPEVSSEEKMLRFCVQYELSPREREILRFILDGKTNCEIADSLFISENTVKYHVRNILKKTNCRNRNEIVTSFAGEETQKKGLLSTHAQI